MATPAPDETKTTAASPGTPESPLEALQTELAQLQQERADLEAKWQRTLADFDNYRKRVLRDREADKLRERARLVGRLLEVLDSFDQALGVEYADGAEAHEGMVQILTQLTGLLKKEGLQPLPAQGLPFDSHLHEALTTRETREYDPDTVVEEVVRGYTLEGQLLRPAKVIVARAPADEVDPKSNSTKSSKPKP